jgi:hypothetical protein
MFRSTSTENSSGLASNARLFPEPCTETRVDKWHEGVGTDFPNHELEEKYRRLGFQCERFGMHLRIGARHQCREAPVQGSPLPQLLHASHPVSIRGLCPGMCFYRADSVLNLCRIGADIPAQAGGTTMNSPMQSSSPPACGSRRRQLSRISEVRCLSLKILKEGVAASPARPIIEIPDFIITKR